MSAFTGNRANRRPIPFKLKFCKVAIKPPIATLQKSKTPVPQGSGFLQIGHSEV
jgi:hypothetical protein